MWSRRRGGGGVRVRAVPRSKGGRRKWLKWLPSLLLGQCHSSLGTCVGRSRNRVQTIIWVPVQNTEAQPLVIVRFFSYFHFGKTDFWSTTVGCVVSELFLFRLVFLFHLLFSFLYIVIKRMSKERQIDVLLAFFMTWHWYQSAKTLSKLNKNLVKMEIANKKNCDQWL